MITITKSESIRFTNKAWREVSASAIVNSWRKADIIENISKNVQNDIVKLACLKRWQHLKHFLF